MARSALSTSGRFGNEKIFPVCSSTNRRSVPGAFVMWSGFLNWSLGKARATRYGCGGSGEPVTFEFVHGTRLSAAGPAAVGPVDRTASQTAPATKRTARDRRTKFMRPTENGASDGRGIVPAGAEVAGRNDWRFGPRAPSRRDLWQR